MPAHELVAVPAKQEITLTSVFNAPRAAIFDLITNPALIPSWWGPSNLVTIVERMELRKGGLWRFIQRDPGGAVHAFNGVYHDVLFPERLVYTFEYESMPGHVMLESLTFEEKDGQTKMIDQLVFQSVEDRDGMLQQGMEAGAFETIERIAGLLVHA